MITYKGDDVQEVNAKTREVTKHTFEGSLLKLTFTFDRKWYEKYDKFKFAGSEYVCISRPRKNEDNTWSVDVLPSGVLLKDKYDTEFIESGLIESIYDRNIS